MDKNNNPGIKELAKLAGVSIGTIDRVLHNRPGVSKKTREKVLHIVKETGYKKNVLASRLKLAARKKIKIAILLPEIKNSLSYWKLPREGIKKAVNELTEQGISVNYYYFDSFIPQSFQKETKHIFTKEFDALITVPLFKNESNQLLKLARQKNIPVVFLDTQQELDLEANYINQNSFAAGMVAGRLLHGLVGSDGLYFVVNILNKTGIQISNYQRDQGFRNFFKVNFPNQPVAIYTINQPLDDGMELKAEILSLIQNEKPKGIFVTNARSYLLPDILKTHRISHTHIVGFDLNHKNLKYLQRGDIHFLINQKPEYQGFSAIKALYKYLIVKDQSELSQEIPIEIVIKENAGFFQGN